ncbi:cell division protein FtsK [Saccharothrix lopnurensis]|uniref:Cell division protein FtsK n=1 Tax=Saccharothrix lopnurensis TaxID=1670621 RepID=A0ABW1P5H7_9PSEU
MAQPLPDEAPSNLVHLPTAAGEPVRQVLDGELVTEAEYQRTRVGRAVEAARSCLPARWQDNAAVVDMTRTVAALPLRYPGAVARGSVVAVRAWWQWVRVSDWYAAAKSTDTLAVRWPEIAAVRKRRALLTLTGTAAGGLGGGVWWWLSDGVTVVAVAGVTTLALAAVGQRRDGSPGRQATLGGARSLAMLMDGDNLVEAFRAAGAIGKAERLLLVERPRNDTSGWSMVLDLPPSRKASDVVSKREALASALAVDEVRLILERVRGDAGHAGRIAVWIGHSDPYARPPVVSPLATAEGWDLWRPVPFGRTARGDRVDLPVVWTSLLIGAIPRMGKTYAARIPVTAAALDPFVRLIVADGKGGKDFRPFERVAHRFIRDARTASALRLVAVLEEAAADVEDRFSRLAEMDDDLCPESKVTPDITRDPDHAMPLTVIAVDEIQNYLENDTTLNPEEPRGKRVGQRICDLLTFIAKTGPAAGYSLVLATQKPDGKVIPDRLRGQLGTRFALKVMTWQASETILGAGTYKAGMDASKLLKAHKGVGLLLGADGESDLSAGESVTVATDLLGIAQIRAACERGRALREQTGTLTGDAAGDTALGELPPEVAALIEQDAAVASTISSDQARDVVDAELVDDTGLPEVLALLVDVVEDHERGLVAVSELADRIGWDPKRFGEALRTAHVKRPTSPRQRVNGSVQPVAVVEFEAIRAAVASW